MIVNTVITYRKLMSLVLESFKFNFFINGFTGKNTKIKNNDKDLEVEISDNSILNSVKFYSNSIDDTQWQLFWKEIDKQGVWEWLDFYFDSTIDHDVPQWELIIEKGNVTKNVWGCNYYPNNFEIFIKLLNKIAKTSISNEDYKLEL